jgi:mannose-6-phosphate isomerase
MNMNAYPLLFTPTYHERIWGGTRLRTLFDYSIPSESTGEAWVISDHPNGRSTIANGVYKGHTIQDLLREHPDWFADHPFERFPILVKLLDACDDLSVQVHPDDEFATLYENGELGKTECWYIVHAEPGAEIVYGHTAKTKEELAEMMAQGQWDELLVRVPVHAGDFFYIPHGTIHALGKGIVVLETQQNSDITYRAFDYDRVDSSGRKRELHVDKVLQVTTVPFVKKDIKVKIMNQGPLRITHYMKGPYFSAEKWELSGHHEGRSLNCFMLLSVLFGSARLRWSEGELVIRKGDHVLLPRTLGQYSLSGDLEAFVSYLPE